MRYFVYGTLLDADVRAAVLGAAAARLDLSPAQLFGYRRVYAPRASYPVLRRSPGASVAGLVLGDLDGSMARALDAYEGSGYVRRPVRICVRGGGSLLAWAFLARSRVAARPAWDLTHWQRRHKSAFLRKLLD